MKSSKSTTTKRRKGRAKSNSARGKEYRAKRKQYETGLELDVLQLRAQVAKLQGTRAPNASQLLQTPYCDTGSLTRTLREYFSLFRFGLNDRSLLSAQMETDFIINKIKRQEEFLLAIMDEEALVGGKDNGPRGSIEQWRLYTLANESLRVELLRIETIHSEGHPMMKVYTRSPFRYSRNTFQLMYPAALHNQALMEKFLHLEVVLNAEFLFQFTEAGLISSVDVEFWFVEAMLRAGCLLTDIAELMQYSVVSPTHAIPPMAHDVEQVVCIETPKPEKLSLQFLLSQDSAEA